MTARMTIDQFVAMTGNVASGEPLLPTFVDPAARVVRALEGVPAGPDVAQITRNWGGGFGVDHYFIAYELEDRIVAEEYQDGVLTAAQDRRRNTDI